MSKINKILKEKKTSILSVSGSYYIRIPREFVKDSSFPLLILKDIVGKLKKGTTVKIKMLENKLIIEEE